MLTAPLTGTVLATTGSAAAPALVAIPSPRRLPALAAVAALLALAVQGWAPAVLDRSPAPSAAPRLDAEAAVERARHVATPDPRQPGALLVADETYRATFDADGFSFSPAGGSSALSVSLRSVARGGEALALDPGAWSASSNVTSRAVAPAVREQVTARNGEVEWDVVLSSRLAGRGDLSVRADVVGVVEATAADGAWRLRLDDGTEVRLGEVVVKDATGAEVHRALPAIDRDAGTVELAVPAPVLDAASYPLTVDPTVSEFVAVSDVGFRYTPRVAFDGTNFLVVWQELVAGGSEIFGARVSGDGSVVGAARRISFDGAATAPDVAWNGTRFLVVWEDVVSQTDSDINGQFVDSGPIPTSSVPISTVFESKQSTPAVAVAGDGTALVVWQDARAGQSDIFGGRLTPAAGALDGNGRQLTTRSESELAPDAAFNGRDFLVAYQLSFSPSDQDVFAQLVNTSASPVGGVTPIDTSGNNETTPAVASNGSSWLVAYRDRGDVSARRVTAFGTNDGDEITVCDFQDDQRDPAVAWNGTYLVTWADRRSSSEWDVFAARVRSDGTVVDPDGFGVADSLANEDFPAVARAPGDDWAAVYEAGPTNGSVIQQRFVSPK